MKNSEVIVQTGEEGQRFKVRAHVEKSESPYVGVNLRITTQYEDTRNPNEERTVFQQHFPTQHEFDSFVSFLVNQRVQLHSQPTN